MANRDETLSMFTSITGAQAHVAEHYLAGFDWDLDRSVNYFFENPPSAATGGNDEDNLPNIGGPQEAVDMTEEDARVAAAIMQNDDAVMQEPMQRASSPHPSIDLTGDTPSDWQGVSRPSTRSAQQPPPQDPGSDVDIQDAEDDDEEAMLRTMAAHRAAGLAAAQDSSQAMEAMMMNMTRGMAGAHGLPSMFPGMAFGGGEGLGSLPAGMGGVAMGRRAGSRRGRPDSTGPGLVVHGRAVSAGGMSGGSRDEDEDADAALARRLMEEEERAAGLGAAGPGSLHQGPSGGAGASGGLGDGEDLAHLGVDRHELEEARMIEAAMMGIPYEPRLPTRGSAAPHPAAVRDPQVSEQRNLRWEQDQAFEESLAADKAKADAVARAAEEAEEEARKEQEMAAVAAQEAEEEAARLAALLERKAASLPPEPGAGTPGAVTVMIRMPDGSRLSRRFSASNELRAVFDFIDLQQPAGTLKPGTYKLVNSYPRKVFTCDAEGSLESAGITADTALFVESV